MATSAALPALLLLLLAGIAAVCLVPCLSAYGWICCSLRACNGRRSSSSTSHPQALPNQWRTPSGAVFSFESLMNNVMQTRLEHPVGASMTISFRSQLTCGAERESSVCLYLPHLPPIPAGLKPELSVALIDERVPGLGVRIIYGKGALCEATGAPRSVTVEVRCPRLHTPTGSLDIKGWEGSDHEQCKYFLIIYANDGCPITPEHRATEPQKEALMARSKVQAPPHPETATPAPAAAAPAPPAAATTPTPTAPPPTAEELAAKALSDTVASISKMGLRSISGCLDSQPPRSTSDCPREGGKAMFITGAHFATDPSFKLDVKIGDRVCLDARVLSAVEITCVLPPGFGENLDVSVKFSSSRMAAETSLSASVSYLVLPDPPMKNLKVAFDDYLALGVGGLEEQLSELYRRVFQSRGLPDDVLKGLGIKHVKGVLLHGPPGSGKTLLARTIGKIIGTEHVTLINTPDLMTKYLGDSEKNLREYFRPAEEEFRKKGAASSLHLLIFDEFDAVFKERGKGDGQASNLAYDGVVNSLLTKLDGLEQYDNVIIFGLTNRLELIDPALQRPGRFEVQLEIGLPKEAGRAQIFQIHTHSMRQYGLLSDDIDIGELARLTPQYSGAEIAGIVRNVASMAIERHTGDSASIKVTMDDFRRALRETSPAYGVASQGLRDQYLPYGLLDCGVEHEVLKSTLDSLVPVRERQQPYLLSILLKGPQGTGKTGLAIDAVFNSSAEMIKVIEPRMFIGLSEAKRVDLLHHTFRDAYKATSALIVLDDFESLIGLTSIGKEMSYTHSLAHTLFTLLKAVPPARANVAVVATSTLAHERPDVIGFEDLFQVHLTVPRLSDESMRTVLNHFKLYRTDGSPFQFDAFQTMPLKGLLAAIEHLAALKHPGRPWLVSQDTLVSTLVQFGMVDNGVRVEDSAVVQGRDGSHFLSKFAP